MLRHLPLANNRRAIVVCRATRDSSEAKRCASSQAMYGTSLSMVVIVAHAIVAQRNIHGAHGGF